MTRRAATPRETSSSSARATEGVEGRGHVERPGVREGALGLLHDGALGEGRAKPHREVVVLDVGADDQQRDGIRERAALGLLLREAGGVGPEDVERTEGRPVPGERQGLHRPVAGGDDERTRQRPARHERLGTDLVHLLARPHRVEARPLVDLGLVHLEVEGPVRGGGQHLEPSVDVDEHRGRLRRQGRRDARDEPGQGAGDVEVGPDHGGIGPGQDVRDAGGLHVDSISCSGLAEKVRRRVMTSCAVRPTLWS